MRNIEPKLKYKTIQSMNISDLDEDINRYLKKGWKLRGDMVVSREQSRYSSSEYTHYNQTIIKKC